MTEKQARYTRYARAARLDRRARLAKARAFLYELRAHMSLGGDHEYAWHLATLVRGYREMAHELGRSAAAYRAYAEAA